MASEAVTLVKQKSKSIKGGEQVEYTYYVLRWHDPQTGKKRGKSIGRVGVMPYREARKKRDLFVAELAKSPDRRNPARASMLKHLCDSFIASRKADGRSEQTIRCYEYAARLLQGFFDPSLPIDRITRTCARNFKTALAANELVHVSRSGRKNKKMGPVSVETHIRHVHAIFAFALDTWEEVLPSNPFRRMRGKQPPSKQWRQVTLEEFWRMYDAASPGWKIMLALGRLAALRRSDALGIRWADVDFDQGVLIFTTQKTSKEARIPMCAELEKILRDARRNTLRLDDLVVPQPRPGETANRRGRGFVSMSNLKRDFDSIRERAGVEAYGDPLHTLRKSCINDWARKHPPNAVMQWATHSSIQTTMKYYAKVSPEDEKRAREPLDAAG